MAIRRVTRPTLLVLRALLAEPARSWYGLELCRATGLPSGTLYPIIARLEQEGWLASEWEDPSLHEQLGRPRRRYYWITGAGVTGATDLIGRRQPAMPLQQTADGVS